MNVFKCVKQFCKTKCQKNIILVLTLFLFVFRITKLVVEHYTSRQAQMRITRKKVKQRANIPTQQKLPTKLKKPTSENRIFMSQGVVIKIHKETHASHCTIHTYTSLSD